MAVDKPVDYPIESGVPLPHKRAPMNNGIAATLRALQLGESVLIAHYTTTKQASAMTSYVSRHTGARFTSRKGRDGVRIWRLS